MMELVVFKRKLCLTKLKYVVRIPSAESLSTFEIIRSLVPRLMERERNNEAGNGRFHVLSLFLLQ